MNAREPDPLAQAFEDHLRVIDERSAAGAAAYAALKKSGQLKSHRLITYRCPRRCLLLDVVMFPDPVGVVFHLPRYRLSPQMNAETSSDEGRARNTEDGDRRWKARTRAAEPQVSLNCDHLRMIVLGRNRVQADLDAGRREVIVSAEDHDPAPEYVNP